MPLIPQSGASNDGAYNPPTSGNMMSVSDDSEFYKENKGSMSLMQILEGLPLDKSSPASRASSKSRILSIESDDDSGSDTGSNGGHSKSYDLMKSQELARELEDEPVVAIAIPKVPKEPEAEEEFPDTPETAVKGLAADDIAVAVDVEDDDEDGEFVDDKDTDTQALLPVAPHAEPEGDSEDDQHSTRM